MADPSPPPEAFRLRIVAAAALALLVLFAAAFAAEANATRADRAERAASLRALLEVASQGLATWANAEQDAARFWAGRPEVVEAARALAPLAQDREALLAAPAQAHLRDRLRPLDGQSHRLGYFVLSHDGLVMASSRDASVGQRSALAEQRWLFDRLARGEVGMSHPVVAEDMLPDNAGNLVSGQVTLFSAAPIHDEGGRTLGYFAVRLRPAPGLLRVLRGARPGASGRTYAFDGAGRLLGDQGSADPARAAGPTRAMEQAARGGEGVDLDGYVDHRGVRVVGAWTWSEPLQLGLVTEIDEAEAYEALTNHRAAIRLLTGLSALLVLLLAALALRGRAQELRTREARAATLAKSEFLARMSHEIRTPMNAILGMTYLVMQSDLRAAQRAQLARVHEAAQGLLRLVNDILDLSKIEAGRMDLEQAPFDLEQLLHELVALMPSQRPEVQLRLQLAPEVPRRVVGDPLRLRQVLVNLVGNALKFTERGEVVVSVDRLPPGPALEGRARLRFQVRDTGIGIDPRDAERLFNPFTQADGSTSRRFGGAGIGLGISKRLVVLMGGTIEATGAPGAGSTFAFTVDLDESREAREALEAFEAAEVHAPLQLGPAPSSPPPSAMQAQALGGVRVLLVEDNEVNQEVAAEMLQLAGAAVSVAGSGAQALELLHARAFDVVLMDVQMPEMDGYETTRRLRAEAQFASLPVIATTAEVLPEQQEQCLAAGMNDHIAKPLDMKLLVETITRWAKPSALARESAVPASSSAAGTASSAAAAAAVAVAGTATAQEIEPAPAAATRPAVVPAAAMAIDGAQVVVAPDLPGFDTRRALARLGGNEALLRKLRSQFRRNQEPAMRDMRAALDAGDLERVRLLSHTLKGVAATVGATEVSSAAAAVEDAAREGAASRLPALLDALEPWLDGAIMALDADGGPAAVLRV